MNNESECMVQWTKHNRNNRFVNLPSLPWHPEISGAVHRVLWQAGRQADEMQVDFLNFKNSLYFKQ